MLDVVCASNLSLLVIAEYGIEGGMDSNGYRVDFQRRDVPNTLVLGKLVEGIPDTEDLKPNTPNTYRCATKVVH